MQNDKQSPNEWSAKALLISIVAIAVSYYGLTDGHWGGPWSPEHYFLGTIFFGSIAVFAISVISMMGAGNVFKIVAGLAIFAVIIYVAFALFKAIAIPIIIVVVILASIFGGGGGGGIIAIIFFRK